jgi:Ser/Thr protein kinase RdoA (MazF antagonist)
LLSTAAEVGPDYVDAVVRGYREYVQLSDHELNRLPGVLNMRPLWLACLDYRESVRNGNVPPVNQDGTGYGFYRPKDMERLAAQAIASLQR